MFENSELFELFENFECFELSEYLELSENSERLENSENSELFKNSENLELSENFEYSLYSDNGGLIYENVYNLHNVRVGGSHISTQSHTPTPHSPYLSLFPHISPYPPLSPLYLPHPLCFYGILHISTYSSITD